MAAPPGLTGMMTPNLRIQVANPPMAGPPPQTDNAVGIPAAEAARMALGEPGRPAQDPAPAGAPAMDRGGRRPRRRVGGSKKVNYGPSQAELDARALGAPGGLTIHAPTQTNRNAYLFGDETPPTLEAHSPPQPFQESIPTVNGVTGIAMDPTRRKTVGKITIPGKGGRKTRRATKNRGDIVVAMMEIRDQVKVYHWQTGKYARHIATNDLVTSLDANIDQFVEVYMGKYGRPKVTKTIKLHNFSESAARAFVAKQTEFLTTKMPRMLKSTDTDLLNIRDTILADVNKTLYLFTLA